MSIRKSSHRFVLAIVVIAALTASASANWTDYINPFAYFGVEPASQSESASLNSFGQPFVIGTCDTAGPIEVEATAGTPGPTAYASLNAAFTAINAGTHQGDINVEVCGNTTEGASAILNSGGVAPAVYTSVIVRPVGGARIIEGTITGAIIKLNGADNVTIDGRQGGVGTARDLTVRNNSTAAATAAIWLASVAAGNGSANNVIRNLELATGIDATSNSTSATFGIIMCGTTIGTTVNGVDNDNNSFIANRIIKARYGVVTRGTTSDLNINPIVTDNIIGPNAFGTDQIAKTGILMQADTGALVSRNTVQFVGCLDPQACVGADRNGIAIGTESWSVSDTTSLTSLNYTVTKNIIHDIVEETTFSLAGIRVGTTQSGGSTGNLVANNFIYNIRANGTTGDQLVGIGISAGNGDRVVNNSISITGDMDPGVAAATTTFGNAIRIPGANGTNNANFTLMNNSIYLDASSSSTAAQRFYPITLNSNAYVFGTGGLNYNNYYINPVNTQLQTGGFNTIGTGNAATTQFATLANWQAALTAPQDANSIQSNPIYVSNTADLHLNAGSPNINAGLTLAGITDDIDAQARPNGANPDIGADEYYALPGVVQFSGATFTELEGNIATISVTRTGGSAGAISVDYAAGGGTATGGAACTAGVDYITPTPGTLNWADADAAAKTFNIQLCNDTVSPETESLNVTLSSPVGTLITGTNPVPLNITDVPAMVYVSSTSTQVTGDAQLGGANQAIIGIQVVTSGTYLPLSVTQLNLSTNGSTSASDIVNAKVYYTGTSNTFATGTQFGSTFASPAGAFTVAGSQTLATGTNYFWLAYDISPTATVDNFVDGEIASMVISAVTQTPTVTAPAGNRQIKAVVTIPGANTNGSSDRKPLGSFFGFERSAAIYTSAELGLSPGSTIQNMCWYLNSSSSPVTPPVRILMKTTTSSTFPAATTVAAEETGTTLVYDATPTLVYTAGTFQCIALTSPFVYSGDNLQVIVETNATGGGNEASGTAKQYRHSAATSAHQTWQADTTAPAGTGTVVSTRPNIQFSYVPPIVAPGNLQLSSATYGGNEGTTLGATVNRVSGSTGSVTVDYTLTDSGGTPATGGASCGGIVDYVNPGTQTLTFGDTVISQPINISLCSDAATDPSETFTITLSNPTGGAGLGSPTVATATIGDIPPPLNGDYQVPGDFATLTAAVAAYNTRGVSGPTRFLLNNATYDAGSGETFPLLISTSGPDTTATNTFSIQPNTGVTSTITGVSTSGIIVIADQFVNIDGDNVGGDVARNLTINNTGTGASSYVVGFFNLGGTKVARNATVRYSNIRGGVTAVGTVSWGIILNGSGGDYDNALIENNKIWQAYVGIGHYGVAATGISNNNVIRNNIIGDATGSNESIKFRGIEIAQSDGLTITANDIFGNAAGNSNGQQAGILQTTGSSNITVTRNNIHDFYYTGTGGLGCFGIWLASSSGTINITNNMIHNIKGDGDVFGTAGTSLHWMPAGIGVGANTAGTVNLDHNSVYLSGATLGSSFTGQSAAVSILSGLTGINLRNNILRNSMTTAGAPDPNNKAYAVAFVGTGAANTAFTTTDYNNYFADGVNPHIGFAANADQTSLASWQTATAQDASSQDVDPQFVSTSDLHLSNPLNTMVGGANPIGVMVDYDNDPRPATTPDIGADEIVGYQGGPLAAGTYYNVSIGVGALGGDVTVTNRLYLQGDVNGGGFMMTLGCDASIIGAGPSNFISNGSVRKDYCAPQVFGYPVGTGIDYSPMDANVTIVATVPSSLTVNVVDDFLPGLVQPSAVSRYWTVTETGNLTADMTFTYLDPTDVNGNEANYKVFRRSGGVTAEATPNNNNPAGNTATVLNVSNFSDWGIGALVPTAAEVSISGRVTTSSGAGIKNAAIVVTGNGLPRPIIAKTASLGYYMIEGLQAGETYVVTVVSKRFTFQVPSRVISLTDSVDDIDFVADPQQ